MPRPSPRPIPDLTPGDAHRFRALVGDGAPCTEWTGVRNHRGYGLFLVQGSYYLAHRIALALDGRDPGGLDACHRCDNPPCCNPAHLFIGTHADNLADAGRKGRMPRGRSHVHNRLTEEQVMDAVARRAAGESERSIARRLGVHPSSVHRIFDGTAWSWLTGITAASPDCWGDNATRGETTVTNSLQTRLHHAAHAHAAHERPGAGSALHTPANRVSPVGGPGGDGSRENQPARGDTRPVSPTARASAAVLLVRRRHAQRAVELQHVRRAVTR